MILVICLRQKGKRLKKKNIPLSITEFKKLRHYCLSNQEDEFNVLVLLALEIGARRGELLGITKADIFKYGIKIQRSISPTNSDISLKTKHSRRDITIKKDVYNALLKLSPKKADYIFKTDGFHQAKQLHDLLNKLDIQKQLFMAYEIHMLHFYSLRISV